MRELALREFVRFIPTRFNIYYLIGLIAAAFTAGLLIFTGNERPNSNGSDSAAIKPDTTIVTMYINIPAGSPIISVPEHAQTGTTKVLSKAADKRKNSIIKQPVIKANNRETTTDIVPAGIKDTFAERAISSMVVASEKKLQGFSGEQQQLFVVSDYSGCVPLKLHFTNEARSYDSCHWTFGDGGYSDQKDPDWIYDVDGEYKVVLQVFGHDGSQSVSTKIITVFPKPKARFEISPEKAILPDDRIHFFNYSSNAVKFRWNFGDGDYLNAI